MDFCFSPLTPPHPPPMRDDSKVLGKLIIRLAKQDDLKGLTEVLTDSFHPPDGLLSWIQPVLRLGIYEDLRSRLRQNTPYYRCLVASQWIETPQGQKEIVVGTTELSLRSGLLNTQEVPYISNLAVSPLYRRKGIAQQLLLRCEQIAQEWEHSSLWLHVLEDNHGAKQLYTLNHYQLSRVEFSLGEWLFKRSQRLLLCKQL